MDKYVCACALFNSILLHVFMISMKYEQLKAATVYH